MFYVINPKTNETLLMSKKEELAKKAAEALGQPYIILKSDK